MSVIVVLALWIPSKTTAPIVVFAALYGAASGAFVSMIGALVAQISDIRQIGVRNGTNFFIISFATLTGNPLAGALITQNDGGYLYLQIFTGVTMFVGSLCILGSRYAQVGMKWKKV
jgi:MFS family permease